MQVIHNTVCKPTKGDSQAVHKPGDCKVKAKCTIQENIKTYHQELIIREESV